MALALPTGDMLETPPGYPFEEINYEDIKVEEVGRCFDELMLLQEEKWKEMVKHI